MGDQISILIIIVLSLSVTHVTSSWRRGHRGAESEYFETPRATLPNLHHARKRPWGSGAGEHHEWWDCVKRGEEEEKATETEKGIQACSPVCNGNRGEDRPSSYPSRPTRVLRILQASNGRCMQGPCSFTFCTAEEAYVDCVVSFGRYEEDSCNARLHQKVDKTRTRMEGSVEEPKLF